MMILTLCFRNFIGGILPVQVHSLKAMAQRARSDIRELRLMTDELLIFVC